MFKGFRNVFMTVRLTFQGVPFETTCAFYNFKKGKREKDEWAMGMQMARGIIGAHGAKGVLKFYAPPFVIFVFLKNLRAVVVVLVIVVVAVVVVSWVGKGGWSSAAEGV